MGRREPGHLLHEEQEAPRLSANQGYPGPVYVPGAVTQSGIPLDLEPIKERV